MTLGSLFDGIGGFPLAGTYCGISPVWASEIEPAPVSITKRHFPEMKHLGDITKINGANIEPVDIITFGSPCQDLSVAGKRAGLKHEGKGDEETTRSGLFMEAVRIIREMRKATNGEYPTFAVWENVPGAFSSNKGEDFRIVLEEICKVKDGSAVIPRHEKGKWSDAGCIMADGYSVAWRVLDAQFWGVPQRRRRIFLVADFTGDSAGEILFKSESVSWHTASGRAQGQGAAADAKRSIGASECYPINTQVITRHNAYGGGSENLAITYAMQRSDELIHSDISSTLSARDYKSATDLVQTNAVRRLTPLECERLQGFPDGWTEQGHDGKPISDSARYKALGNSLAIPCAFFVLHGTSIIAKKKTRPPRLAPEASAD